MLRGMSGAGVETGIVSTGLNVREFVEQMHSLSYDIVDELLSNRVLFFSAEPGAAADRTPLGSLFAPSPLWQGDVVFVDSLDGLLSRDPEFGAAVDRGNSADVIRRVVSELRTHTNTGTTVVLAVNDRPLPEGALYPLRNAASVYLDIQLSRVGQEVRREAVVRRFAGPREPINDTISFTIAEGRGLMIESKTVA